MSLPAFVALRALISVLICALFALIQIQASGASGVLALPVTYDDNGYFVDAAERVEALWAGRPWDVLVGYVQNPPHAPGASILAFLGFSIFGIHAWAAAAANAVILTIFVFLIFWATREFPIILSTFLVLTFLTIPFFGISIVEFRPDMWCSAFVVYGTMTIAICDPRRTVNAVTAGMCLAAALLFKPTFVPLIGLLFATAIFLRLVPTIRSTCSLWAAARSASLVLVIGILPALPHYMLTYENIIWYFQEHVFGTGAAFWTPKLTLVDNLLYYVVGPGGKPWLGIWFYIAAFALLETIIYIWFRDRKILRKMGVVWFLVAITYAIVTIPGNKSAFLGVTFSTYIVAILILWTIYSSKIIYRRNIAVAYVFVGILFFISAAFYQFPWVSLHQKNVDRQLIAAKNYTIDKIVETLKNDSEIESKYVMLAQVEQYMNPETLTFRFMEARGPRPKILSDYYSSDLNKQINLMSQAHYIISITPDYPNGLSWLPLYSIANEVNHILGPKIGFRKERTIIPMSLPGQILIYKREPN